MTLQDYVEVIRRIDSDIPSNEVALHLNGYYRDICNYTECLIETATHTVDGTKTHYTLADFLISEEKFMKPRRIYLNEGTILRGKEGTIGDKVWVKLDNDRFAIGKLEYDGPVALSAGEVINMDYFAYPTKVTVATTGELPIPQVHHLLLWRLKADIFSEQRQWDRTGYFNRRYERGLQEFRKMIWSSGTLNINNTNMEI